MKILLIALGAAMVVMSIPGMLVIIILLFQKRGRK